MLLLSLLMVSAAAAVTETAIVDSSDDAVSYLTKYGYLQPGKPVGSGDLNRGICHFQYMAGLNQTCELDESTIAMMNKPRCGMPDIIENGPDPRRAKRYSYVRAWPTSAVTFRIDSVTSDIPRREDVEETFVRALQFWSNASSLTFTRVFGDTPANIVINFFKRAHGDGARFDGRGGVLAHAYFPLDGRVHLDEDEYWTIDGDPGTDLLWVAVHEFGHALGLGHTHVDEAVMAPVYSGYVSNLQLNDDDIAGIQALYGDGSATSGPPDEDMSPIPGSCTGIVDAVTTTRDRSTYTFEGNLVWKFERRTSQIATGFPKPINQVFPGLPDNIDAALYYPPYGKTYIFKGSQYWRTDNEVVDTGYPRDISSDWSGLPNDLDAAFIWRRNGRIYFFKGDQYYRYNGRVEGGYPRPSSVWRIPGNRIGAAVQWLNRRTYFFHPSGEYYRFNDWRFRVDRGYPKSVAPIWQGCPGNLMDLMELNAEESGVSGLAPSLLALIMSTVLAVNFVK
ncbi:72 kDa type IV collagenase-like isoform X2 [Patiria miniata]|nr:72 kDa type IV collagenase-like isoform X2 [Patiria miniata]